MSRLAPHIDLYRVLLLQMRRSVIAGGVVVNAKPVFVLTLMDLIESGCVTSNHFTYSKDLATAYEARWKKHIYSMTPTPVCKPFFHLTNDQFWHIQWKEPVCFTSSSDKRMRDYVDFGYLDNALWDLLQDQEVRDYYRKELVDYFLSDNE